MNRSGWDFPTACAVIASTALTVGMTAIIPSAALADPVLVQSETKVTPALTIAERYDSNVYFIPGKNLEDYVTTVTPQLKFDHSDRFVAGSLIGMLTGEAYAKNPGLNYIAPSGALNMNLDGLVGQMDKKAKLTVSDSFAFTPKPLAFLGPGTGSEAPDTFVRGIQTSRANSRTNVAAATGSYQFTPSAALQGNYTNSMFRFGTIFAAPNTATTQPAGTAFFSTTFQSYNVGPRFTVTPLDVITINYQGSRADYSLPTGSHSSFQTQGANLMWSHMFSPTLTANGTGGFTVLGKGPSSIFTYVGDASLQWKHEHGDMALRYSRSVFPSFFIVAVPLLSQVITLSGTYGIYGNLSVTGSVNYAKNESTSGQVPLSFESYSTLVSLNYTITRAISAIASFTHSEFNQTFTGIDTTFTRNILSLSLRGEWN